MNYSIYSWGAFGINHIILSNFVVVPAIECLFATVNRGKIMTIIGVSTVIYGSTHVELMGTKRNARIYKYETPSFVNIVIYISKPMIIKCSVEGKIWFDSIFQVTKVYTVWVLNVLYWKGLWIHSHRWTIVVERMPSGEAYFMATRFGELFCRSDWSVLMANRNVIRIKLS